MTLNAYQKKELAERCCEKMAKIESRASALSALSRARFLYEKQLDDIPNDVVPFCEDTLDDVLNQCEQTINGARGNIFSLYWLLSEPETFGSTLTIFDACTSEIQDRFCSVFKVKAVVFSGNLVVKTPLLWSRYSHKNSSGTGVRRSDYLRFFDRELRSELLKIESQIPQYETRHIAYLHVVPKAAARVADSDNYDTKHITDTISDFMIGGDGAFVCSFSNFSILEGELPPGSYAVVSDNFQNPRSLSELCGVLKNSQIL